MSNFPETGIRLKDAEYFLRSAENNLLLGDYRVVVQSAQLCIELSAKAVIAFYEALLDSSEQLLKILEEHRGELAEVLKVESLLLLAEDAKVASPG